MKTAAVLLALASVALHQGESNSYWVDTHAGTTGNPYWSGTTSAPATSNNNNNNNVYNPPATTTPKSADTSKPVTQKPVARSKPKTFKPAAAGTSVPLTFSPSGWGKYNPGSLIPATFRPFATIFPVVTIAPIAQVPAKTPSAPVATTSKPTTTPTVVPVVTTATPTKTPKAPKPTKTPKPAKPTKTPKPAKDPKDDDDQMDDTPVATPAPTVKPAVQQTPATTEAPTVKPTVAPTEAPTVAPTEAPTAAPTAASTVAPTAAPTAAPTVAPTAAPTEAPTEAPTAAVTEAPTEAPIPAPAPVSTLPASNWPTATETVLLDAPQVVAAGEVFDGAMKKYDRSNVLCDEAKAMVSDDAVFIVQSGGVLKNVIIGGNQVTGVFCSENKCALDNVWAEDVCQAALVVDTGLGTSTVTGGGVKAASQRVIYGKSGGTVTVSGNFYMEGSAQLYESCGTCGPVKRTIIVDGVTSVSPTAELVRVNKNYMDEANIVNATIYTSTTDYQVCSRYDGGKVPTLVGTGVDGTVCHFTDTAVSIVSS